MKKIKVAIIGTGNIGTDLLMKIQRSLYLECSLFTGRNFLSPGMLKASALGIKISDRGIDSIIEDPSICDIVFDATSALNHFEHAPILKKLNKFVIDMTPAKIGIQCIPAVNLDEAIKSDNVNMITCGGQASIPLAYAISKAQPNLEYVETISTIASRSAGPGTRINIDEYISATEKGLKDFTKIKETKAMINLNPGNPAVDMQTTVIVEVENPNLEQIKFEINKIVTLIQQYVPGYEVIVEPTYDNGVLLTTVKVIGLGDYLPKFAGNLDIINCAAIAVAEKYAKNKLGVKS